MIFNKMKEKSKSLAPPQKYFAYQQTQQTQRAITERLPNNLHQVDNKNSRQSSIHLL